MMAAVVPGTVVWLALAGGAVVWLTAWRYRPDGWWVPGEWCAGSSARGCPAA